MMNGGLRGEMGLQSYHQQQQPPNMHTHQAFSQLQEPAHYDNSNTPNLSLNPLQSIPAVASTPPTASLGQYIISTPQPHGDLGYKLNPDTSDHSLLSVQSSPATSFPSLPPLTAHPSSSSSSSSANSPITLIGGSGSISEANSTSILFTQMNPPASNADRTLSNPSSDRTLSNPSSDRTLSNPSSDRTLSSCSSMLLTQMNQLGPSERCTPSQAQAMGQQLLGIMAQTKRTKALLPSELQNSFDVFHRCLAVVYGTFFLNLYTKANAPCLLCHGCKSLYPPGQFIHHTCPTLPPNILPCRSRMWRRCLVPLVSPGMDKLQQKQRWKYVLEKFSHTAAALAGRRNAIPPEIEAQLLEMPELKRGRFVESPSGSRQKRGENGTGEEGASAGKGVGYAVKTEEAFEERMGVMEGGKGGGGGGGGEGRILGGGGEVRMEGVEVKMGVGGGGEEGGTRFQGLVNLEERECLKQEGSSSPEANTQNLLDIEPPEYELEEGTSPPTDDTPVLGPPAPQVEPSGAGGGTSSSAVGLAEQLTAEVRKLQQELCVYRAKLSTATEIIEKMPSEACMREQLAQALATQQTVVMERDHAKEQFKLAQDRGSRLQQQLDNLRTAYNNMEKLFIM